MRAYRAMSCAFATNTATPAFSDRDRTDPRTSRSSIPLPRTISNATASPPFHALMTGRGRPGPGISDSGVTAAPAAANPTPPAAGGAPATDAELTSGEAGTALAPTTLELEVAGVGAEVVEVEELELPLCRFIIMNSPTATS